MASPNAPDRIEIAAVATPSGGSAAGLCVALEEGLVTAIQVARPDNAARLSALNLELAGVVASGEALIVKAWVERATRTLAFVGAEVFAGERRVATGGGVFELS